MPGMRSRRHRQPCARPPSAGATRHQRGGTRGRWPGQGAGLVEARATAVAIDPAGAGVDQRAHAARTGAPGRAPGPRVRGSVAPCPGGGARCSTASARPPSRPSVAGSSRLPSSGTAPGSGAKRRSARPSEVSASTRQRAAAGAARAADIAATDDEQIWGGRSGRSAGASVAAAGTMRRGRRVYVPPALLPCWPVARPISP
jgi:hypothetical protein